MLSHLPDHTQLTKILNGLVEEIADKAVDQSESSSHDVALSKKEDADLDSIFQDVPDSPYIVDLEKATRDELEKHPHLQKFFSVLDLIPELLEKKLSELHPTFQPFTELSNNFSAASTFYLNEHGTTCIHGPDDEQPSTEQQQAAAQRFFAALEDCFGKEAIEIIAPAEQQQQPLTIEKTHEVFDKIRDTLEHINEFLKTNPLLITPEYIIQLSSNPEAAIVAQQSYDELGTEGRTWML